MSPLERPFGAVGKEQLDDAQHPTAARAVHPGWMRHWLPLQAGDPHPNSVSCTAGSGQPGKYIFLS